jgi:hypothetical protein
MNSQKGRTFQEAVTTLTPAQVLAAAKQFFGAHSSVYAAFVEREGANYLTLRGQGGEEIVIAAHSSEGVTTASGSSYMFDQQVARFLSSLPVAERESVA